MNLSLTEEAKDIALNLYQNNFQLSDIAQEVNCRIQNFPNWEKQILIQLVKIEFKKIQSFNN